MEQLQNTVDIVDKLTTAYYAALGLVFTIFLGIIVFLIYDKNSLKKEMRDKYNEILELKVQELQKEFNKGLKRIESKNSLKLILLETQTYHYYTVDSLRNPATRSNKELIWSIILNLLNKHSNYLKRVKKNSEITDAYKSTQAEKEFSNVSVIIKGCQNPRYLLFKRLNETSKKYIESINSKITELNKQFSELAPFSKKELKIPIIKIEQMIESQKNTKDLQGKLKTIEKIRKNK